MSLSDLATKTTDRPGPLAPPLRRNDAFAAATILRNARRGGGGRAGAAARLARREGRALSARRLGPTLGVGSLR